MHVAVRNINYGRRHEVNVELSTLAGTMSPPFSFFLARTRKRANFYARHVGSKFMWGRYFGVAILFDQVRLRNWYLNYLSYFVVEQLILLTLKYT